MKKWFPLLVLLFVIYFSFQFLFKLYIKGYDITYQIKTEEKTFKIKEKYSSNQKKDFDNYYLNIEFDNENYSIQTLEQFQKKSRIIKEIYHIKTNNYSCIFPIFLDKKILTDIICLKNGIQYNYHTIRKEDKQIDAFEELMKEKGYDPTFYVDMKNDSIKENLYTLYPNNLVKDHIVSFNTYKGVEIISKKEDK